MTIPQHTPMKLTRIYKYRKQVCGNIIELRDYPKDRYVYTKENFNQKRADEFIGISRDDSIKRARRAIYDIVEGNFLRFPNPFFCTFTFALNEQEVTYCFSEYRKFLRRLSWYYFGNDRALEHISIAERQKRGAIHFHAVFFNLPKDCINERKTRALARMWGLGFVDLRDARRTLGGFEVESLGAYLAKYLGKDNIIRFGKNFYLSSRGLSRPSIELSTVPFKQIGVFLKRTIVTGRDGQLKINKYKIL